MSLRHLLLDDALYRHALSLADPGMDKSDLVREAIDPQAPRQRTGKRNYATRLNVASNALIPISSPPNARFIAFICDGFFISRNALAANAV